MPEESVEKVKRDDKSALTINECMAARFLAADGYSRGELAMVLERAEPAINRHVNGDCGHENVSEPLPTGRLSGEELRRARLDSEMTQTDLANEIGVSTSTISQWENGRRRPRRDKSHKIWEALGDV